MMIGPRPRALTYLYRGCDVQEILLISWLFSLSFGMLVCEFVFFFAGFVKSSAWLQSWPERQAFCASPTNSCRVQIIIMVVTTNISPPCFDARLRRAESHWLNSASLHFTAVVCACVHFILSNDERMHACVHARVHTFLCVQAQTTADRGEMHGRTVPLQHRALCTLDMFYIYSLQMSKHQRWYSHIHTGCSVQAQDTDAVVCHALNSIIVSF